MTSPLDLIRAIHDISHPQLLIKSCDGIHTSRPTQSNLASLPDNAYVPAIRPENLGSSEFKRRHGLKYAYVAGAMANAIASTALVKTMGQNGMVGFFGAGGLSLSHIESAILELKESLGEKPFGFNLIHSLADPGHEMATVKLYIHHGITLISAAAFLRITLPLVYYRVKGIHKNRQGEIITPNRVIAKVSRIEVARQFFAPPPEKLLSQLVEQKMITSEEAVLASEIPMAQDLTAEADSGGHTDNRPALALLPTFIALRNEAMATYNFKTALCVGLGGGIATPESAAAAFSMGAAYILTGSINQACVESGICEDVKKLLSQAEQADVAMAPSADMFEIGARVQVLKRGTLFPVRAEKLYQFYKNYRCFSDLPLAAQKEIEEKYLLTSFDAAWQSTRQFFLSRGSQQEVDRAEQDPSHKMALVFRSYLGQSSKWAIQGNPLRKMDYQVWCGPAMGAFNQWVKGSFLEPHTNRFAAEIAMNLLTGACVVARAAFARAQGIELPPGAGLFSPMPLKDIFNLISSDSM